MCKQASVDCCAVHAKSILLRLCQACAVRNGFAPEPCLSAWHLRLLYCEESGKALGRVPRFAYCLKAALKPSGEMQKAVIPPALSCLNQQVCPVRSAGGNLLTIDAQCSHNTQASSFSKLMTVMGQLQQCGI